MRQANQTVAEDGAEESDVKPGGKLPGHPVGLLYAETF